MNMNVSKSNDNKMDLPLSKILLVEDNIMLQSVSSTFLRGFGCKVEIASNGLEALSMFKNGYQAIFLDIGLPDISGLTVAKAIRSEEMQKAYKKNIIIALTACDHNMAEQCYQAGIDDFYTKPITPELLKQVLVKWLPNFIR